MAKPKLYVESTVISVLTARPSREPHLAAMQEWTRRWWAEKRGDFELFTSKYVLDEIGDGDPEIAAKRIEVANELSILIDSKTSRRLARKLIIALGIPKSARPDAFHVAIAIEGGMDFLLTWNCAHIANPYHQRTIRTMAMQRGYNSPVICTPHHFFGMVADDS